MATDHSLGERTPQVTVLMCVYNTAAYVQAAVESVLRQTLPDLELIVVDDHSTDGSWDIITDCETRDARIRAIRQPDTRGAASALNRGLELARGRLLTRQDSDDVSLPRRLELQAAFLADHPEVGAVGTAVMLVDDCDNNLGPVYYPTSDAELQSTLPDRMCFCGPTVMVDRRSFIAAGFSFDEELSGSEDYDLCLRLAEVTRLSNLSEPLYRYRQHPASVSRARRAEQLARKAAALRKAVRRRYGPSPQPEFLGWLARDYLRTAIAAFCCGEGELARDALNQALGFDPGLFDKPHPLEKIVRRQVRTAPPWEAISMVNELFGQFLPRRPALAKHRSRILSDLHMREVFEGARLNQRERVRNHLWQGVQHRPAWLLNRGVWSILRSLIGRKSRDTGTSSVVDRGSARTESPRN